MMIRKIGLKKRAINFLNHPVINFLCFIFATTALLAAISAAITAFSATMTHNAFAEDLLSGTATDLYDTINGEGKKFLYLIEIVIAIGSYIKTKNLWLLTGVITIAVAFNICLKVAGF